MDTWRSLLTFTYSSVLSEIVIAGRFLSKLYTWDIWLVDSNIIFVFFELSARWESLDQELTVLSVEFSSFAHLCSSGAGQLEYFVAWIIERPVFLLSMIVVSSAYWNEPIEEGRWSADRKHRGYKLTLGGESTLVAHQTICSLIQMHDHRSVQNVTGHWSSNSTSAETTSRNQALIT